MISKLPLINVDPQEMKFILRRDACISVFTDALFTGAKRVDQPKCPSTDECINVSTTKHYIASREKEIVSWQWYGWPWRIYQYGKSNPAWYHLYMEPKTTEVRLVKVRLVATEAGVKWGREMITKGCNMLFLQKHIFLFHSIMKIILDYYVFQKSLW